MSLLFAALAPLALAQSAPLPDGAVSWWPGDSDALDAAGQNHGALTNGVYDAGLVGDAFYFGAGAGMVEIPEDDSLDPGMGDFSVEGWIRTPSANVAIIACKRGYASEQGWCLYLRYGYLYARVVDTNYTTGRWGYESLYLADDQWHHVAMTVDRDDPTGAVFYIDGQAVTHFDPTVLSAPIQNDYSLFLGRDTLSGYENSQYFAGWIDEFAYYDVALSAQEIGAIYDAGADGKTIGGEDTGDTGWVDTGDTGFAGDDTGGLSDDTGPAGDDTGSAGDDTGGGADTGGEDCESVCGCAAAPAAGGLWGLALIAAAAARRRRRGPCDQGAGVANAASAAL